MTSIKVEITYVSQIFVRHDCTLDTMLTRYGWRDISVNLNSEVPVWPGNPSFSISRHRQIPNDVSNDSIITMDVHTGTHVESSLHRLQDGKSIDDYPLSSFIFVLKVLDLQSAIEKPQDIIRNHESAVFFRSSSSALNFLGKSVFRHDFDGLSIELANQVVEQGFEAVGIDYLSISPLKDSRDVHEIFFEREMLVFESLDLREINPGYYECIALPLPLMDAEASPCRVLVREFDS